MCIFGDARVANFFGEKKNNLKLHKKSDSKYIFRGEELEDVVVTEQTQRSHRNILLPNHYLIYLPSFSIFTNNILSTIFFGTENNFYYAEKFCFCAGKGLFTWFH